MSDNPRELRRDVEAALSTRAELGPDYDEHIAAGLADRVEQLVAMRTAELRVRSSTTDREYEAEKTARSQRFVLGIVSLGAGVPITAIAGAMVDPGLAGVLVAWVGIVGVNIAAGWGNRRR
jgi:hypothetical protein